MIKQLFSLAGTALGVTALLVLSGCGDSTMAQVSGTVNYDGQPIEKGVISFYPLDTTQSNPMGGDIVDGKYAVKAPVGKSRVTISMPKVRDHKKLYNTPDSPSYPRYKESLPDKYSHMTNSELRLDVPAGGMVKDWELSSK